MTSNLIDEVTEAMHRSQCSPRKDKWVPLTGFSHDYQNGMRLMAESAVAAVRKWDEESKA